MVFPSMKNQVSRVNAEHFTKPSAENQSTIGGNGFWLLSHQMREEVGFGLAGRFAISIERDACARE
jgi:hypothetical protein